LSSFDDAIKVAKDLFLDFSKHNMLNLLVAPTHALGINLLESNKNDEKDSNNDTHHSADNNMVTNRSQLNKRKNVFRTSQQDNRSNFRRRGNFQSHRARNQFGRKWFNNNRKSSLICFNCNKSGHTQKFCFARRRQTSFAHPSFARRRCSSCRSHNQSFGSSINHLTHNTHMPASTCSNLNKNQDHHNTVSYTCLCPQSAHSSSDPPNAS